MLRTARLTLEAIEPAHASALFEGLHDAALYQYIDDGPPDSLELLQARYERWACRRSPDGQEIWLNWAVRWAETSNYVGVIQATVHPDHSAAIAYILFRSKWGQGYAREALAQVLHHLEEQYEVTTYTATVDPRNERSIRLLAALGFEQTGIHLNTATIRGTLADEAQYSKRNWKNL